MNAASTVNTSLRLTFAVLLATACDSVDAGRESEAESRSTYPAGGELRHYISYRTTDEIEVDGRLDESAWRAAAWSDEFVDIEGYWRPPPERRTRIKLLWDDECLYIGAELEEPHLWATLTERDAVIYRDNDFEVFIDPDGDTHNYYELELNALGTVWDLFLAKPYRDGGKARSDWHIAGLRSAVSVQGTVNDPSDRDEGWTVELAIPWSALTVTAGGGQAPTDGEHWRINFSRVQWQLELVEGGYRKATQEGRPLAERNWVWSPQGAVNMHMPEMWGIVQFSDLAAGQGEVPFRAPADENLRWALRQVYYAQRSYYRENHRYADDPAQLSLELAAPDGSPWQLELTATAESFQAWAPGAGGTIWRIRQDGRVWSEQGEA